MSIKDIAHNTWVIICANNGFAHAEYCEAQIARAIQEAVADEREACAQVAVKVQADLEHTDWFELEKMHVPSVAAEIATAIRTRS